MKSGFIYILFFLFITCNTEVLHAQGNFGARKYTKGKIKNWIENIFGGKTVRGIDTVINVLLQSRNDLLKTETTLNILNKKSPDEKIEFEESSWANELIEEIKTVTREIDKLLDEASNLNPFSKKDKNRLTEISLGLTELINKKIKPFKRVRMQIENSKILESDYSFAVGKFELSKNAKLDIGKFPEEWKNEILIWKNYVDPNGTNLYKNDKIQVRINIVGYADKQGKGSQFERENYNKDLSTKRAEAVKKEVQNIIKALQKEYGLDLELISIGKGEELPPKTKDPTLIDNPDRRIVIVTAVIFPAQLLKK